MIAECVHLQMKVWTMKMNKKSIRNGHPHSDRPKWQSITMPLWNDERNKIVWFSLRKLQNCYCIPIARSFFCSPIGDTDSRKYWWWLTSTRGQENSLCHTLDRSHHNPQTFDWKRSRYKFAIKEQNERTKWPFLHKRQINNGKIYRFACGCVLWHKQPTAAYASLSIYFCERKHKDDSAFVTRLHTPSVRRTHVWQ